MHDSDIDQVAEIKLRRQYGEVEARIWARVEASTLPRRRRRSAAMWVSVGLAGALAISGGAVAYGARQSATHSAASSVQEAAVVAGQGPTSALAEKIVDIVDPTQGGRRETADGKSYGYAGIVNSGATRSATLYWVGEVPANIQAILDSAPEGSSFTVAPAEHTLFEQEEAAQRIINSDDETQLLGVKIYQIEPIPGGGLDVGFKDPSGHIPLEKVAVVLSTMAGMPVSLQPGGEIDFQ